MQRIALRARQRFAPVVVVAVAFGATACGGAAPRATQPERSRPAPTTTGTVEHAEPVRDGWSAPTEHEPGPLSADDAGTVVHVRDSVIALDGDGRRQWEHDVEDLGIQYPALDGDLVVVSSVTGFDETARGAFVALDRETGRERWSVEVPGEPGPVTFAAGAVFAATTNGHVYRLTRDGEQVWHWVDREPIEISSRGSLAYDATTDRLGLTAHTKRGWVLGFLDARDGSLAAGLPLGVERTPSAAAAAGDGRFVVGDGTTNEVLVVDAQSDDVTAGVRTDGEFDPASVPVVADGVAYVVNRIGTVTAIEVATGRLRWQTPLRMVVRDVRPVLTDDALVLAGWLGPVRALARADGRAVPVPIDEDAGIVAGFATRADEVVVSLRFGAPSRVAAWPVP